MSDINDAAPAAEEALSGPEASAEEVIGSIEESDGAHAGNVDAGEELDTAEASDEELEDVLDDENASDEEKEDAVQELKKRLKLKVNGKEIEEEIDFNDEDRLREILQKGHAADSKFQEAANLRKQMEQFVQLMQSDPIRALRELGHDPDDIAEKHMKHRLEEMQLSPEQRRVNELNAKLEKMEAEKKALEEEKLQEQQSRAQQEYERQLDKEMTEALESSTLPKSPYVVKRIAETMMAALDSAEEGQEIRVADVLPHVEKSIKSEIQQMFGALPGDVIEKILGDNVTSKMRKYRRSKIKKTPETASSVKATGNAEIKANADSKKEDKPSSAKDFFSNIGSY